MSNKIRSLPKIGDIAQDYVMKLYKPVLSCQGYTREGYYFYNKQLDKLDGPYSTKETALASFQVNQIQRS
jgi:hypothetical protein